ncbi:MAG: F0F1 ATP synthase subunit B [Sarcina sp.]
MEISWQQVLATIINFIILLIILRIVFWNKIKLGIEARQNLIKEKIADANRNFEESEELKTKNREILKSASVEAQKISDVKKQQAMKRYDEIVNEAKSKASLILDKAEVDIQREGEKLRYQVKEEAVNLAVDLSKKAVGEELDETKHKQIIDKFIEQVGI